jgi:hypothetical protein
MNDVLFSPIPLTEIEILIQKSVGAAMVNFQSSTVPKDDKPPFMGFDKACEFLDIAPRTLKGYIAAGTIPNIKKEGKVYFDRAELIEWLRSGRRKTTLELKAEASTYVTLKKRA